MTRPLQWFDDTADHPSWINALEEVRRQATREGYCYHHVQAIIVAIDQYAELRSAIASSSGASRIASVASGKVRRLKGA